MNTQATSCNQSTCAQSGGGGGDARVSRPEFRAERSEAGVSLHLALPGVPRDQIQLQVEDDLLKVTAERSPNVPEDWNIHQEHAHPERYELVLRLHPDLDPSRIAAELRDGVLTLEIERQEARKPRTIAVN